MRLSLSVPAAFAKPKPCHRCFERCHRCQLKIQVFKQQMTVKTDIWSACGLGQRKNWLKIVGEKPHMGTSSEKDRAFFFRKIGLLGWIELIGLIHCFRDLFDSTIDGWTGLDWTGLDGLC